MLRYLSIERLAIIDAVALEFAPGLNVLTGETGAGKSIVVGAVDLLLGGRASGDLVREGEEKAIVQAVLDDDGGNEHVIRREISAAGRSRAFVDGTLVTSQDLRAFTAPLVDLHGQHDHQALLDPATHVAVLDRYGGLESLTTDVGDACARWRASRDALAALDLDERERAARLEVLKFQLSELDRVGVRPGEDDELVQTRQILVNADRLQRLYSEAYAQLYEGEGAVLEKLTLTWRRIDELATLDPGFVGLDEVRTSVQAQLEDVVYRLRERLTHLDTSPERLQQVEDRLAAIERLKRRYGPTLPDILARRTSLAAEREALSTATDQLAVLTKRLAVERERYLSLARNLSLQRRTCARPFAADLAQELTSLAMPGTTCEVRFGSGELPEGQWSARGIDMAEFYLSANVGEAPKPLARIASGGELSRIMLGLKTLASLDQAGKTLIFDEVDAGIGGRAADAVGARLRKLGSDFQVLCITHLPQVAAHGHVHYRVSKEVRGGRTATLVERLSADERIDELARMMAGSAHTPAVVEGARALLDARQLPTEIEDMAKGERRKRKANLGG
jgi:DNA repair protein RecN (Recombination protein N)